MSNKVGLSLLVPVLASSVVVSVTTLFLWKRIIRKQQEGVTVSQLYLCPIKSCEELPVDAATPLLLVEALRAIALPK
jgi:hypothetical protein